MTDYEYEDVPFRATHYNYKVSLGTVMDRKALSWSLRVFTREWEDAKRVVDMWHDQTENAVAEIETNWTKHDH
jgi:hypothetical protein